jgi:type II secretory pathway component PulK
MTRRGVALLAVLWTITVVTILSGLAMAVARIGSLTTRNRVLLARAGWAREACAEILFARYAQGLRRPGLDREDLGRGTWCDSAVEEPATKLNLNLADRPALLTVLRTVVPGWTVDSLADALLAQRAHGAFADVRELTEVPGFTDSLLAWLSRVLTTRGTGLIDVNTAPPEVLAALPGMSEEAVELVVARREASPIANTETLVAWLSPRARALLLASYSQFARAAAFRPPEFVALVRGGVQGASLLAHGTLTLVPVGGRLAVIQRTTE